ncbi:hypothetical protein Acr_10g0006790 [Actinidia rufa]|uniref:Uncharacterized protein n=1 Tax=Actinidia rufa TaxID=165716 RepID=A0A7J0F9B4_9ERIC|nr:hypothetical protein Acr_10g0006790 [Actinidia rufa]
MVRSPIKIRFSQNPIRIAVESVTRQLNRLVQLKSACFGGDRNDDRASFGGERGLKIGFLENRDVLEFDDDLGINGLGDVAGGHVPFDAAILVDSEKWRKKSWVTSLEYIERERKGMLRLPENFDHCHCCIDL